MYLIERDEPWFFEAIQSIEGEMYVVLCPLTSNYEDSTSNWFQRSAQTSTYCHRYKDVMIRPDWQGT